MSNRAQPSVRSFALWLAICLSLPVLVATVGVDTAFAQVSDSELNAMARVGNANRDGVNSGAAVPNSKIDFFDLMVKGGVFMIPIGIASLMVVTFVFDRLIGLRFGKLLPSKFKKELHQLTRQGEVDPRVVYKLCGDSPSATANIVRCMLLKTGRPNSEIISATQEAMQREADRAYSNVRWLNLAAGVAPLLGLLGTVSGLIRAFQDTTRLPPGLNRADFLAVGIYEALVTTMAGLMVAIPAAVASHYFEGRITKIFGAIEELVMEILPSLERYEGRTRFESIGRELAARDLLVSSHSVGPPMASVVPPPASIHRTIVKTESRPRPVKPNE
jgi:biopolymer transport protein ExbB